MNGVGEEIEGGANGIGVRVFLANECCKVRLKVEGEGEMEDENVLRSLFVLSRALSNRNE